VPGSAQSRPARSAPVVRGRRPHGWPRRETARGGSARARRITSRASMRIAIVFRPVPALKGSEADRQGFRPPPRGRADREEFDRRSTPVLIPNQPTFYPRALAQLRALGDKRPRVVAWMSEPLVHRGVRPAVARRTIAMDQSRAPRQGVIDARSNERRRSRSSARGWSTRSRPRPSPASSASPRSVSMPPGPAVDRPARLFRLGLGARHPRPVPRGDGRPAPAGARMAPAAGGHRPDRGRRLEGPAFWATTDAAREPRRDHLNLNRFAGNFPTRA